jgi:DNA helicase-2/ATP-dependent DNA helicase PcrA
VNWSEFQLAAFEAVKALSSKPSGALVIEAGPGSGKTTTGIEMLRCTGMTQRVLFLAFNKHIAEELKRRVPPNVEAATVNGYGFRAVRAAWKGVKLDDWKTRLAMREFVADADERRRWDGAMKRLIGLKKAVINMEAAEIAKRYDLDLPTDPRFMETAALVWKRVCSQTTIIDFDDQWFLPVLKKLPLATYDFVFVDEAQDLCATQIELLKRIAPRIVAIGDPRQAIYGFRGADPEAMENLTKVLNADVLPLSICYRCPKVVVAAANEVLEDWDTEHSTQTPKIQPAPDAIDGTIDEVDVKNLRSECQQGSWVLCRTTAPLVKECLKFIIEGVKATVKGRDIGQQLVSLIEKVGGHEIVEFTKRLEEYHAGEKVRLEAAGRDAQLQALDDRVESIYALSEGARTVSDVVTRIENIFKDEASTGVTFATAHRSKGLEANDIYILCPELMPFPKAKSEWARKQERNLKYVAFTRAMKRLRMVTGTRKAK